MRGLPVTDRLPALEGLRGLLALYVLLGHIASMADPSALAGKPSAAPEWIRNLFAPFAFGHLAVAGFIVLSGFCLQLSLYVNGDGTVKSAGKFFRRRAWRLLPAYYGCLVLSWLVCETVTKRFTGMPFDLYLPVTTENLLAHIALVHNFRPDWMYKINGVLWSIAIECQIYIVFPVLALIMQRVGRLVAVIAACLFPLIIAVSSPQWPKLYGWYVVLFAIGMVGASMLYRPPVAQSPKAVYGYVAGGLGMVGVWLSINQAALLPVRDLAGAFVISGLSYAVCTNPESFLARVLGWRPVALLGAMSYSLYLMHHPIQQVGFYLLNGAALDAAGKFWVLVQWLPVVLLGSLAFYMLFERPVLSNRSESGQEQRNDFPLHLPLNVLEIEVELALRA
jgi:peptidoglycan/LPS O-acetylase OafA/YrhL